MLAIMMIIIDKRELSYMGSKTTALVTGGTRGIGAKITQQLIHDGYFVFVNYLHSSSFDMFLSNIPERNNVFGIQANISSEIEVKKMIETINEEVFKLDLLVNNAGIDIPQKIQFHSDNDFLKVLNTNLYGKYLCTKYAIPLLSKSSNANIVNISSRFSSRPLEEAAAYCSSQAGVIMLTKVSALELASIPIRVNCVIPGFTDTDMNRIIFPDINDWDEIAKRIPLKSIHKGEDIGKIVSYLSSDASTYITGSIISVDGGISLTS